MPLSGRAYSESHFNKVLGSWFAGCDLRGVSGQIGLTSVQMLQTGNRVKTSPAGVICLVGEDRRAGPQVAQQLSAIGASAVWPAVRSSRTGLPSASTRAWIFVIRPPRESPMQGSAYPVFSAGTKPVNANTRTVDHHDVSTVTP